VIRATLSVLARVASRRHYRTVRVGAGSRVDFWKLKAKERNSLQIGASSMFACRVVFERPDASLTVGTRSFVGLGLMSIAQRVEIGDDVMISWGSTIVDHNSHSISARQRGADVVQWLKGQKDWTGIKIAPVRIENHAWLGFNVSILPGVVVGEGAVIGACSLLTGDVPAWTIAAGSPARVLRQLTADERA